MKRRHKIIPRKMSNKLGLRQVEAEDHRSQGRYDLYRLIFIVLGHDIEDGRENKRVRKAC
jgi:hypothetical protein